MRTSLRPIAAACIAACLVIWTGAPTPAAQPRFFDDDPLHRAVDTQDASRVQPWEISLTYDSLLNLFGHPGGTAAPGRAADINTIGDVPDSSWFTNRLGVHDMTPEEMTRGVNDDTGPAEGVWTVRSGKGNGVSPGFTITDTHGKRYFVKFDPPEWNELATGAEVVVTRIYHAIGYYVPQTNIAFIRREDLVLGEGATTTGANGEKRRMHDGDIDSNLRRAARMNDGRYRVIVSEALPGTPLGGYRYLGTRPDDPNDIVPHEDRRSLRALRVVGAWVDHTDAKAINTLDTLIKENNRAFVRHNLLDFGSTLGSAGIGPRDPQEGYEYMVDAHRALHALPAFGFNPRPWMSYDYPEYRRVGRFQARDFRPDTWVPRQPNPAFLRSRPDDLFWGARLLARMSDDLIRAAVKAGRYSDPKTEDALVQILSARRDRILATWLTGVNGLVDPELSSDGTLTFHNAAVEAGVLHPFASYAAVWSRFDNATGQATRIDETSGTTTIAAPAGLPSGPGAFVQVDVTPVGGDAASAAARKPVHLWFKRLADAWKLVGLDREI